MAIFVLFPLVVCLALAASTASPALALRRFAGLWRRPGVGLRGRPRRRRCWTDRPRRLGGLLRVDALSAFMLMVVGAVGLTATWGGLPDAHRRPRPPATYPTLVALFLGAMSLAVLADNLGVLWVAVEATTIATAFLVGHHGTRRSLEAAWKYVVLGSVGVAIALLGLVLLYAATVAAGAPTLSWSPDPGHLAARPVAGPVAAALAVLGFATKAGLAPMHSWLPDAHSQAPAPVSGLMSGVLLSVAFYAILRVQAIADPVLGPGLMRGLLLDRRAPVARGRRRADDRASVTSSGCSPTRASSTWGCSRSPRRSAGSSRSPLPAARPGPRAGQVEPLRRLRPDPRRRGNHSIAGIRGLLARRPGVAVPSSPGWRPCSGSRRSACSSPRSPSSSPASKADSLG